MDIGSKCCCSPSEDFKPGRKIVSAQLSENRHDWFVENKLQTARLSIKRMIEVV